MGKTQNIAWHGADLESAFPNCVRTTACQILLKNALQSQKFRKWALTIITESELQNILRFLLIAFIFTSSKCDVIIYSSYDPPPPPPTLAARHVAKETRQKMYLYIYVFNGTGQL